MALEQPNSEHFITWYFDDQPLSEESFYGAIVENINSSKVVAEVFFGKALVTGLCQKAVVFTPASPLGIKYSLSR